ncbi:regulatory particle triple-A ATPase 5A [Actinidia rufa]|uniref:Regulatory particle triple-A ATPase 5A n=1 Tax=Actinidia rufa TaxID=165716 RepID=A0A7J0ER65_9ERIC|nr:regulatory particle triple-A ATPase 5A [Actinidia rufa]
MASPMVEDSSFEEDQLASMSTDDIIRASRLLDNEIRILKEELQRTNLELDSFKEKIKENQEKIKLNKQLPYLVGNIVEAPLHPPSYKPGCYSQFLPQTCPYLQITFAVEVVQTWESAIRVGLQSPSILEMNPEDEAEEDGANIDLDSQRKGKCVVLKTSTRQTIFLPVVGLVDPDKLKPGDLVGVNKDSYLILDTLPSEYDSRVKAMEVDEKPTEDYNDIGGLEKQASFLYSDLDAFKIEQIQELVEAIVLPMTHAERFQKLGVRPPKGVLLYGPPGTGKTLMARACAAQTNATFLKLAGPQLVQMFIGDGAKLVRDAFLLAKEKSPCIIFIDEIDAIGTKRFDSEVSGDREVQRTMLELLNQLDGFSSDDRIKVIAATNRADILDPALMRSGRLDRKIEFPHPTEEARARILQIHSRKMNVHPDVNFEELARSTDDFNGAQLKAVCVEAGMLALRRDATEVNHEDFNEGIIQVQAKKKASLNYYA